MWSCIAGWKCFPTVLRKVGKYLEPVRQRDTPQDWNSRLYRHYNFETRHLLLVLDGYEAGSLTLREEQRLWKQDNSVLKKYYRLTWNVTECQIVLQDDRLHMMHSPSKIIRVIESTRRRTADTYSTQRDRKCMKTTLSHIILYSRFRASWLYINKIQRDATVCRYLFTAKLLYVFLVSMETIIRST